MKSKSKDFKSLSPQQVTVFYDTLLSLIQKHTPGEMPKGQDLAKIRLELRSMIGREGIRLTTSSFNSQMTKAMSKYQARLQQKEQAQKNDSENKPVEQPKNNDVKPKDTPNKALDKYEEIKMPEYMLGDVVKKNANKNVYSAGERIIANKLESMGIPYLHEATIDGLVTEYRKDIALPCDFVINVSNTLAIIEYNGKQHYEAGKDVVYYSRLVTNDSRRIKFATSTGIPLLVIHYQDGIESTIKEIIDQFVNDIKRDNQESKSYTKQTYGYFGKYQKENDKRLADLFPNTEYPHMNVDNYLGYIAIDSQNIIIWEKEKLLQLIEDNERLTEKINEFYRQNKELRAQLLEITDELKMSAHQQQKQEPETTQVPAEVIKAQITSGSKQTTKELQNFIQKQNSSTPQQIQYLLEQYGLNLSQSTIRRYMKQP